MPPADRHRLARPAFLLPKAVQHNRPMRRVRHALDDLPRAHFRWRLHRADPREHQIPQGVRRVIDLRFLDVFDVAFAIPKPRQRRERPDQYPALLRNEESIRLEKAVDALPSANPRITCLGWTRESITDASSLSDSLCNRFLPGAVVEGIGAKEKLRKSFRALLAVSASFKESRSQHPRSDVVGHP